MKKITVFVVLVSMLFVTTSFAKVYTQLVLVSNENGVLVVDVQAKSDDGEPLISLYRGAFKISETLEKRVTFVGFDNLVFTSPDYKTQIGYSSDYRKFYWVYTYNTGNAGPYASIPEDWLSVLRVRIIYNTADEIASLSWAGSPSYLVLDENGKDITGDYMPIPPELQDFPLPVEMSVYSANIENNTAVVKWRTESELNNLGFNVYRSENEESGFVRLTGELIRGQGSTSTPHDYQYIDKSILPKVDYWYAIETISLDGLSTFYGPFPATVSSAIASGTPEMPVNFMLRQNYPNPFNPETQIRYELSAASDVKLTIYDILGNEIVSLVDGHQVAGRYSVAWDGTARNGQRLESGIFIYELRAGEQVFYHKMTMIK
ncbi:T9SS C-terminal target domain-containing protein [candidate division KSB1 bacterium]|nr:T9SS type A sorting domain-containing protein [candidate division KSB1 bacterium]RQW05109.1 MAG: T9SS C-terminal target domain-containing protein [candidate division KSB1 bacterium]